MTAVTAETEQIVKSAASPSYFARQTTTRDSSTGRFVPLVPWEHQQKVLAALCRSPRLAVLHGAGTGTTTAVLAYAVWTALFRPGVTVRLHGEGNRETLVKQARHLVYRLPRHLRPDSITVENSQELSFSTGSRIVGFDPGHDVALVVADGDGFAAADTAPARQTVLLSRPGSAAFEALYRGGRYERLFVPFSARPGRSGLVAGGGPESEAEALGDTGEEAVPPFREFVEWAWPLVSNDPFKTGLHVEAITRHLQLVADGQVRKLVIQCPIRHGKSLLTSVLNPVWRWLRDPALRLMTSTYSQELTLRDANRSKLLVEHPRLRERFGRRLALADSNTRLDFYHTGRGGYRFSTSVGARTSGFDADAIIADDLHPMSDRYSRADRERAIDYFFTTLSNRLVLTGRESLVLAGHRVHEQDVMQAVQDRFGGEFTYLVLPAEADPEHTRTFPNRHWTDPRQAGELLWPAVFGHEQLAEKKKELRHDYSPVFNQKPVPPEGSLFRVDWFRSYAPQDGAYRLGEKTFNRAGFTRVITVDLAIGQKADSDWTVAQVWDLGFGQMVLVHQTRERVDGARVIPLLQSLYKTWKPSVVAVESVAYQQAVIDQLRALNVPVKKVVPDRDKEARSIPAQVRAEAGTVWIPAGKDFTADWLAEIGAFPLGRWDDQVDAFSMAADLAERWAGSPADPDPTPAAPESSRLRELLWADTPF